MNKKHFFSAMLVCFMAFGLIFVSCGGNSKLAGIWESEAGLMESRSRNETVEFFSNGTVNWDGMIGTWTAENNRLMINFRDYEGGTMDYKLSGKTLTLTYEGQSFIYTKK